MNKYLMALLSVNTCAPWIVISNASMEYNEVMYLIGRRMRWKFFDDSRLGKCLVWWTRFPITWCDHLNLIDDVSCNCEIKQIRNVTKLTEAPWKTNTDFHRWSTPNWKRTHLQCINLSAHFIFISISKDASWISISLTAIRSPPSWLFKSHFP
jgi:hypothetical protein